MSRIRPIQGRVIEGDVAQLVFPCDDAAGFELRILRAPDYDYHISVVPCRETFDREHEGDDGLFAPCYSASIRVRMPMMGGGSHEELYAALAKVFRAFDKQPKRSEQP